MSIRQVNELNRQAREQYTADRGSQPRKFTCGDGCFTLYGSRKEKGGHWDPDQL